MLNSFSLQTMMAIWCSVGARTCIDWLQRMLYLGGDTDTIGAVAGRPNESRTHLTRAAFRVWSLIKGVMSSSLCSGRCNLAQQPGLALFAACDDAGQVACPFLELHDVIDAYRFLWLNLLAVFGKRCSCESFQPLLVQASCCAGWHEWPDCGRYQRCRATILLQASF